MKRKNILALAALTLSLGSTAQTITFDTEDYAGLGVYDTWEASPFRTGRLNGNYAVIDNHLTDVEDILGMAPNTSSRILAVQRSRFGSNTFGVRVRLKETFELTPTPRYIHMLVHRPYSGRVMVVGLGKRRDRAGQSADTEQFWAMTMTNVPAGRWQEVVLPIKGNGGIDINSLVVVPDCESPHDYTTDGICYIDEITINDDPQAGFSYDVYPVNFDKEQTPTRNDRWLTSFTLASPADGSQTVTPPTSPKRVYSYITGQTLKARPGETLTPTFNYTGSWMHGYVYLDKDNNGKFDATVNEDLSLPAGSDLLSFAFYSGNPTNDDSGKNSAGQTLTGNNRNVITPPAFTLPADLPFGIYRMRVKVDWNCIDPAGNTDSSNPILGNGGNIVDILLNVHGDNCSVNDANRNGEVLSAAGDKLNNFQTPFGQPFTIKMNPEKGFEYAGIIVKHGYNLSGDSIVNDNIQWQQTRFDRKLFTEDDQFTIPAECMDGNVEIEGLFIEDGTYVPTQDPTRYTTTVITDGQFADTTSWYTIQIGQDGYVLTDNGANDYISLNTTEVNTEDPSHLWCFVGNENVGYQIYNKQAGASRVLAAPTQMLGTTGSQSYPTLQPADALPTDYTATWRFMDSDKLGTTGPAYAYMYEDGNDMYAVNNRDGRLAFWSEGKDAGSTLRIFFAHKDIPTGIVRTELGDGPRVTYDLSGRAVSAPTKGIYIREGKKIYVK